MELLVTENRERDRKWDEKWSQWDNRLGTLVGTVDKLVGVVENVARKRVACIEALVAEEPV